MLNSRKFEVLDKVYHMNSTTLYNTEYWVQIILGTSTQYYKHFNSDPIHGNGQGSESTKKNWVHIIVPIMSTLDKNEEGCIIISSDKKIKWEKIIVRCVDDKRKYANDWKKIIIHRLQQPSISSTKLGISSLYFWW